MKNPSLVLLLGLVFLTGCTSPKADNKVVHVAVIGGLVGNGLWTEVANRFEKDTGYKVELVSSGDRSLVAEDFRAGKADLCTMHSGDITTDLVADGFGVNMRPWTRNELVIVGPTSDPAKVRGMNDGAAALRKIAEAQANLVDFRNIGSREVTHRLWEKSGVRPQGPWLLQDQSSSPEEVVEFAKTKNAYVIVGRLPVLSGRLAVAGMEILVQNDPAMRKPYIVMEANPKKFPNANIKGARMLSDYLLASKTQEFIAGFGKQTGQAFFFPMREL